MPHHTFQMNPLRAARKARNLTLQYVADIMRIRGHRYPLSEICNLEKHTDTNAETKFKIAEIIEAIESSSNIKMISSDFDNLKLTKENLRRLRQHLGFTTNEVAQVCRAVGIRDGKGLSNISYVLYETGKLTPNPEVWDLLNSFLSEPKPVAKLYKMLDKDIPENRRGPKSSIGPVSLRIVENVVDLDGTFATLMGLGNIARIQKDDLYSIFGSVNLGELDAKKDLNSGLSRLDDLVVLRAKKIEEIAGMLPSPASLKEIRGWHKITQSELGDKILADDLPNLNADYISRFENNAAKFSEETWSQILKTLKKFAQKIDDDYNQSRLSVKEKYGNK
ncbi:MAG: hypothetical protein Q7K26_06365 [bacterium]|nr:hypothetical protein [bacterium]